MFAERQFRQDEQMCSLHMIDTLYWVNTLVQIISNYYSAYNLFKFIES